MSDLRFKVGDKVRVQTGGDSEERDFIGTVVGYGAVWDYTVAAGDIPQWPDSLGPFPADEAEVSPVDNRAVILAQLREFLDRLEMEEV